jgi:hypothetical protein
MKTDKRIYDAMDNIKSIAYSNDDLGGLMYALQAIRERKEFCKVALEQQMSQGEYMADLLESYNKKIRDILRV